MSILKIVTVLLCVFVLSSCNNKDQNSKIISSEKLIVSSQKLKTSKSQLIINETIIAHGGELYDSAEYSFDFRGNKYQFKNNLKNCEYKKNVLKNDILTEDILKNGEFLRFTNNTPVKLTDKQITAATGALNSVVYFATLPHKLSDKAVNTKFIESTIIKNKPYNTIEITFNKEGGGQDHEDTFYYWINKETKKIDYFAYNYMVNKGGVRFRSAYNSRVIDGITFQDYINYKADVGTPLKDLPTLYEAKELKELSKIKTENIINLNKN